MKGVFLALALAVAALGAAQDPIRLKIRHADPWAVKALLEGFQLRSPELSTIALITGNGGLMGAAAGQAFFKSGRFMVNPTDNSLWFIPEPL